ncbi:MAG: Ig domain-containing protein [Candidatus Harrisonbacteria bacterium]|nr:Ig domain-containing protein [Candidatus Harrisonbacteria bacterium]
MKAKNTILTGLLAFAVVVSLSGAGFAVNAATFACSDGIDNDRDGLIDSADPGCTSPTDNSEMGGSGTGSTGSASGGSSAGSTSGSSSGFFAIFSCSDGIDNDRDGFTDMADPGCSSPTDNSEINPVSSPPPHVPQCRDGIDNDGDGLIDMDDPGCTHPDDNDEGPFNPPSQTPQCRDGIDNDGDGLIDMADPGCSHPDDNDEGPFHGGGSTLRVSCEVSDTRIDEGDRVTYEAEISGGTAPFDIDWRGDIRGDDRVERVRFNREGTFEVDVRVRDSFGRTASDDCRDVRVGDRDDRGGFDDRVRIISTPVTIAVQGQLYSYQVRVINRDNDQVRFALVQGPSGMSINPSTGLIQWVPNASHVNRSHFVSVRAIDNDGGDTQNYSVFVRSSGPEVVFVPGPTRTVVVGTAVADLDIFDLRVENDDNLNVIVSFQTTIPAQGSVHYSLSSHVDDEEQGLSAYEFRRDGFGPTTFHQINLGQLQMNTTYYMKAHAVAGNQTDTTGELGFVQLPTGIVFGADIDRGDNTFASALASIGYFLISPWFLLLIIIILLIILLMRRSAEPTHVHSSGPVEIKS